MRSVRLSWKTAQALLAEHRGTLGDQSWAWANLEKAVRAPPKRSVVAAKKVRTAKRLTKKEETMVIRVVVFDRAHGRCEACREPASDADPLELDHMFGRVRVRQSARTTWAIHRSCHRSKTNNEPTPEAWLTMFAAHCDRHGFRAEKQLALNRAESRAVIGSLRVAR